MKHKQVKALKRWNQARAYAASQRCDQAVACEYADHVVDHVTPGLDHAETFPRWIAELAALTTRQGA
jgi:hypothetical protein